LSSSAVESLERKWIYVGTLNQGVLHWHAGTAESFSEEQGLPDRQVQAISLAGDKTHVGTPLGLLVTSLDAGKEELLVGTEEQGVVKVALAAQRAGAVPHGTPNLPEVRQFL
jgi:hypothetical protein